MNNEVSATELVQLPGIIKPSGEVHLFPPSVNQMSVSQLEKMAELMGGQLFYPKMRAIYTPSETPLCGQKECWRPVYENTEWCDTHIPR